VLPLAGMSRPRTPIQPGDGDPRHGTVNGYGNLQCRCPDCTEAYRVRHLADMHSHPDRAQRHAKRMALRRQALKGVESVPT
jgi:hypothetical protein